MARTVAQLILVSTLLVDWAAAATLKSHVLTKTKPATCSSAIQSPPAGTTSFLTTDTEFYLWFYFSDVKRGDVAESLYYTPSGTLYTAASGPWDPADADYSNMCFTDVAFKIAGATPASMPGNWTVKVKYNNVEAFTINFTISAPGTNPQPGGLNVTLNQVISSQCPQIRVVASVTNSSGTPVTGLTASNFTLKEDGAVQNIQVVSSGSGGSGSALSLALVIDQSGSVSGQALSDEKAAGKALIAQLGASDAVALFSFSSSVNKLRDFTTDRNSLNAGIDSISATGTTALYAAVVQAAQALAPRSGRKAIVLLTDGENNEAGTEAEAINQAKLAGAPIFPVGFGGVDHDALDRLAKGTGGVYSRSASSANLTSILQAIGQTITSQYEIIYTTSNSSASHTVEVTANSGGATSTAATTTVGACSASGSGVNLVIQGTTGRAGSAVDVPVTLTSTGTPPTTFQLDVTYDPAKLRFNQARKGEQLTAANKDVSTNTLSSTTFRVIGAGLNQNPIGNGPVAYLNFNLLSTFTGGNTTLACSEARSSDSQGRALATTCTAGAVTSAASCGCDVNNDGRSDVQDVQIIINQVLGVVTASCDVNGDGAINVSDVQIVVNAALGLGCR